jgi:hypothetical protein
MVAITRLQRLAAPPDETPARLVAMIDGDE